MIRWWPGNFCEFYGSFTLIHNINFYRKFDPGPKSKKSMKFRHLPAKDASTNLVSTIEHLSSGSSIEAFFTKLLSANQSFQ